MKFQYNYIPLHAQSILGSHVQLTLLYSLSQRTAGFQVKVLSTFSEVNWNMEISNIIVVSVWFLIDKIKKRTQNAAHGENITQWPEVAAFIVLEEHGVHGASMQNNTNKPTSTPKQENIILSY